MAKIIVVNGMSRKPHVGRREIFCAEHGVDKTPIHKFFETFDIRLESADIRPEN
jgi:hypothetical protein